MRRGVCRSMHYIFTDVYVHIYIYIYLKYLVTIFIRLWQVWNADGHMCWKPRFRRGARCSFFSSWGISHGTIAPSSVLKHQSWCDICCGLAKAFFFVVESGAKRRMQEHALHIYRCIYIYIYERKICCYYHHTSMTSSNFCYARSCRCSLPLVSLLRVVIAFCSWMLDMKATVSPRRSFAHSSVLEVSVMVRLHLPQFLSISHGAIFAAALRRHFFS